MRTLICLCLLAAPAGASNFVYDAGLKAIEARRIELGAAYEGADTATKARIRAEARALVLATADSVIFPAWMGMPWGLGKNSTARRPFEPGMVVGCSYFVTSVLEALGLKLSNRYHFAQAAALHIQRSLAPAKGDMRAFFSIPPAELAQRIARLGPGLYLIGLNNHVGFVRVRGQRVHFIHSSYTDDRTVTEEPLAAAQAIKNSQKAGYFVSPVFQDDRLIEHWLMGKKVPFRKG